MRQRILSVSSIESSNSGSLHRPRHGLMSRPAVLGVRRRAPKLYKEACFGDGTKRSRAARNYWIGLACTTSRRAGWEPRRPSEPQGACDHETLDPCRGDSGRSCRRMSGSDAHIKEHWCNIFPGASSWDDLSIPTADFLVPFVERNAFGAQGHQRRANRYAGRRILCRVP